MDISLALGLSFAVLCALVTNLAFLFKHRGATAAPPVDVRHPLASAANLFRSKWWLIGWGVAVIAWLFHVLALALTPISLAQVVLASGVVLLAVMADRLFGFAVGRRQWAGLIAIAVGLGLIVAVQPAVDDSHAVFSTGSMAAFQGGLFALAALLIAVPRGLGLRAAQQGAALGAASGVLFGASDVALKALTDLLSQDGLLGLLSPWTATAIAASVAAFYSSARALQDGEAVAVIAITGTAANVVGIAGGVAVFGDPLPDDTTGVVLQGLAFALIVLAGALMPAPVRAAGVEPVAPAGVTDDAGYVEHVHVQPGASDGAPKRRSTSRRRPHLGRPLGASR